MARFYRDRGIPEVERLARACCIARGHDPDEQTRETGYDETTIPRWWFYQDQAQDFFAMMAAGPAPVGEEGPDQRRVTIVLHRRPDGGLRVHSDNLPGLILSGADQDEVVLDIGVAIKRLLEHRGEWPSPAIDGATDGGR